MTPSQTLEIDGIGPVLFEQSRRARRIIISIRRPGKVRVAIPRRSSFKTAIEFVHLKKEWVQEHLAKMARDESHKEPFEDPLQGVDKAAAKRQLTTRLSYVAAKCGFTYNNCCIRQQKTRWGSCSAKNNISLNVRLILLPQELADYVILHELVHTRIHNHSKKFWAELDRYVPNSKAMAKQLRLNGVGLR